MRTLVKRALLIPHGGMLYVDQRDGQPAVVWLAADAFSEADAQRIYRELNGSGRKPASRYGS